MLARHPDLKPVPPTFKGLPLAPRTWRELPCYRSAPLTVRESVDQALREFTGWLGAALPDDRHTFLRGDVYALRNQLRDPARSRARREAAAVALIVHLAVRRYETVGRIQIRRDGPAHVAVKARASS